jgi:hypothetical protein
LTGTITVKTTMKKKLAYVTNSNDAARRDDAFTTALGADFDVNIINSATTGVNYDVYDIIVLSAVPASGDAGLAELKNVSITKPFVNMKTYQLQSSRWNWLTPANNPGKTTVTVTAAGKTHPLFAGFDFNASDDVILTTKTDGNMVVTFSGWIGDSDPAIVLATEKESGNASYAEIPTGTIVNGMTNPTSAKHIILGLSEAAWDGLTEAAVTLCVNAAKYAADIQTPVKIIKNSPKTVVNKQYFDLSGRVVTPKAKGFVIEKSYYEDGSASFEKLFKK